MGSERPTLMPPFDPEAFARESESKLRVVPSSAPDLGSSIKIRRAESHPDIDTAPPPASTKHAAPQYEELSLDDFERPTSELPLPPPPKLTITSVPRLAMSPDRMRGMQLDHRAGFILSHVDGVSDVETILDVSGMPQAEALQILNELAAKGIIVDA